MSRPPLLFVTYYRVVPTAQIGVFKRCIRLMHHLVGDFDIHLLNFGPLPDGDPELAALRDRITLHDLPGDGVAEGMTRILRDVSRWRS